jgi:CubicO group peptidase (beta-lactamase class C family)
MNAEQGEDPPMTRLFRFALTFLALSAPALANDLVPPEKVGLSSKRLDRLTSYFKMEVDGARMPGAVIAIWRKGQLAYFEAVGYRDPATKAPMPRDAIFSLDSMTKPMVSVAIMMLHEEGKLALGDPVGKFLPSLANRQVGVVKTDPTGKATVETVAAVRQPTVQDLLRHTAGFAYGFRGTTEIHKMWPLSSTNAAVTLTAAEFLDKIAKAPLLHQPGTVWDFSLSVDVLGLIVEAVSGKPLAAYLEERLWQPLGMVDTAFSVAPAKSGRYALAFPEDPLTKQPQSVLHAAGKPLKFDCGGACAVSTAADYMRFARMMLGGGTLEGKRLLSRKTVELMTSDQLGPEVRARTTLLPGHSFGLGFAVRTDTGIAPQAGTVGDYTWAGFFGTYFWVDPREDMAVVYMAAAPNPSAIGTYFKMVRALALQAIAD